jgi:pimeloyl-ACP methyl ester carboxylesterase
LSACTTPAQRADRLAARADFVKDVVAARHFRHVVYRNSAKEPRGVLHVYIEGDGTPYIDGVSVAADPTPRAPLMLHLMVLDPAPSIYLGRPCYFGLARDPGCNPAEWTLRRFAPEVLDSMASALRAEIAHAAAVHVELFGHSGGGALAVLLAQRIESVERVVTVAPTLDTAAWCKLHGYVPLDGSLNPVDLPRDRPGLSVVHWVGDRDSNTPATMVEAAARVRDEPVRVVPGFDHRCCWNTIWRQILDVARVEH